MNKVACKDCQHFREAPYQAPHTGCWWPDHMLSSQKEAYLDQQQIPGDHKKINLRGDCPDFSARAKAPGLLQRIFSLGA